MTMTALLDACDELRGAMRDFGRAADDITMIRLRFVLPGVEKMHRARPWKKNKRSGFGR